MRKLIIMIAMLSICLLNAAALERIQESAGEINARFEGLRQSPMPEYENQYGEGDEFPDTPMISRTFAFPYSEATVQINQMTWRVFDTEGNYQSTRTEILPDAVVAMQPFRFREMQGVTVKINTQYSTADEVLTLDELDFSLSGSGTVDYPLSLSSAFVDAYKALADNWDSSYLRNLPLSRPKMLIISHQNLSTYQADFIRWKRQLGIEVFVINKADAGNSLQEIKNAINTHYQEHHADYLMLFGDTVGTYAIPTNFFPSPEYAENDADDQYYALLDGDDYFPEMLVGRFSFNDIMEFLVMTTKTIRYESQPFMEDTSWMKRALAVAGNYAEGGLRPTTPVLMSRWFRDRLLDFGYAQVDTVFYPPSYPGTYPIQQSINQGVQLISYRGWGDANGWHYPSFHIPDLNNTYNGQKMPIVYSIVCNTGDFANSVNPSFGEKWMRMGTTANLGGCVAFVGPSDLHTKTRLNNTISSGAYRSILDYGVRGFGTSVLMGKIELYKNYLNDLEPGMYVPFYFHVYNILSDPSMNMWILEPNVMTENILDDGLSFAQSASHISITAPNLEGALVSGSKDGVNFEYAKVVDGVAILNIDPEVSGDLLLTVSKPNWVPLVRTLTVGSDAGIGVVSNSAADLTLNANQSIDAAITLKNYGSVNLSGITASIDALENLDISLQNADAFALAPGATHTLNFSLAANNQIKPGDVINLTLRTANPASTHMFRLAGGGARLSVWNHSANPAVGQSTNITFSVANNGTAAMQNAQVIPYSRTEAAIIAPTPISIGDINPGEDKTFSVPINIQSGAWDGRNIPLRFEFSDAGGYEWMALYAVTAGSPSVNDPTGPDEYGYFAYDSGDTDYDKAPTYNWVELDPLLGGSGTLWTVMDDGVLDVQLPFSFRFYGVDYESVTISSNGWISFVPCAEAYFNNHYIPAALGPQALVAAYWDDLKGKKTGVDASNNDIFADMRILHWYDSANNRFIVQWNEAYNQYTIQAGDDASLEKFQIILYPIDGADGDVVIQYHTVDNPGTTTNYCTVGLEDHHQLSGLTYSYCNVYPVTAQELVAGLAIRFSTTAPDNYVSASDGVMPVPVTNLRNYPNPFNPTTSIAFDLKTAAAVTLAIYNTKGQLVRYLHKGDLEAGTNSFVWDGTDLSGRTVASGIYLYRLDLGAQSYSRKMLLMK